MDFDEKAKIRLEHWLKHSDGHIGDYRAFVQELEDAGKQASADLIKQMADLAEKSKDLLNQALKKLND